MVTMLAKDLPPNVSLCAADCNKVSMDRTMLTKIAFDYLILTFKVKMSAENTRYFLKPVFLTLFPW